MQDIRATIVALRQVGTEPTSLRGALMGAVAAPADRTGGRSELPPRTPAATAD